MIKLPSYLTGFSSKVDGSASIRFATQELSPEDFGLLKENLNNFGWLIFAENATESDIPSEDAEEEGISDSERLRRRMFVFWKAKINEGDFNTWKKKQIEKIGQNYLDKLND